MLENNFSTMEATINGSSNQIKLQAITLCNVTTDTITISRHAIH